MMEKHFLIKKTKEGFFLSEGNDVILGDPEKFDSKIPLLRKLKELLEKPIEEVDNSVS